MSTATHTSHAKTAKAAKDPGFAVGQHVKHVASHDGGFPEGAGVIELVQTLNTGDHVYSVRCDATGKVLPVLFAESDLKAE